MKSEQTQSPFLSSELVDRIERVAEAGHWRVDLENNELFWSDGVFMIHGLSPDSYKPEVISAIEAYVPEDREHVSACVERAIEEGLPYTFECRIQRPDGEIRHVISQGEAEKNKAGKVVAIFGVIKDLTHIKEQEQRFRLAALGSNSAMWDWDILNDKIYWAGRSYAVLGVKSNDDLPCQSTEFFETLVHKDDQEKLKKAFADHFGQKSEFYIELRVHRSEHEYMWVLARAQAQWNTNGQAIRISGSLTDINELKTMEQHLLRSNEDLNQFASIAAHDLQQPLRAISGFLTLLQDKYEDTFDETAQKYIAQSIKGAENMSALVTDLLEYSRLETDGLKPKKHNITEILNTTILSLQSLIEENGAMITMNEIPEIVCDGLKLQRVFYNLIENAIKYRSTDSPRINISATELPDGAWQFSVADNGVGIEEKNLEAIFLMFNRLHSRNIYKGTGVGLAICKKIIDLHNGQIHVESNTGKGSVFHFTIPRQSEL